jgi:hypothetical protein
LIGEDGVVCDRVGAGAGDLAKKKAVETAVAFKLAFLLVIDVEEINLAAPIRQILGDAYEQTAQDRCAKRIEKEEQTWASRQGKLNRISATDLCWRVYPAQCSPTTEIATGNANKRRMDLHPHNSMKGHFGSQQDGASHACADVDKSGFADGRGGFRSPPSLDECAKNRRSDAIVGRGVAIVRMSTLQVPAGDKTARADAIRDVEWVTHESVRNSKTWQKAALACGAHACTVAHASRSRTNQVSTKGIRLAREGWNRSQPSFCFRPAQGQILRIVTPLMAAITFSGCR